MTIADEVAGVGGAALGYIHDNFRGAVAGYQIAKDLSRWRRGRQVSKVHVRRRAGRAPTSTGLTVKNVQKFLTKNNEDMQTPRRTPSKRKLSFSSRRGSTASSRSSRSSLSSFGRGGSIAGSGGRYGSVGSNAAAVLVKRKRGVRNKKKRSVQVTSRFKQKVHKALDEEIKGKYLKVMHRRIGPVATANTQQTFDDGIIFQPLDFADAADVLFNRAVAVETPTLANLEWTNVYIRKDRILNSWASYEMKNMSQRTYTLKMYLCKPKAKAPTNITPDDPFADWVVGLQIANGAGTNPAGNTPNTLYSMPTDSPQFNQFWKAECTTVVLQPGQSHTFRVQGPSNYVLDYTKYGNRSILGLPDYLAAWGPFSRSVFFVMYPDLITSDLAGSGRFVSTGAGPGGVVFEKKLFFAMACPASAGFQYPAAFPASTSQQLTNKLPCKVIFVAPSGVVGAPQDMLEENPISSVNPID